MKRTLFLCIALLAMATFGWSQTISSITPNSIQPGYSGVVSVTGSGVNFSQSTAGLNLRLTHVGTGQIYNFGSAPGGGAWSPGYNGMPATTASGTISLPGNAPTGNYDVTVLGYHGLSWSLNLQVTGNALLNVSVPPNVGYFTGKVVLETDSNCVQSVGEDGLANRLIYANPGNYIAATDALGNFSLPLPLGTYTLSTLTSGTSIVCPPAPYTINATVNTSGGTASGLNFFMKSNHTLDLSTTLTVGIHRPGFSNNTWWVQVRNNTPTPANNVVAMLVKPSNISFSTFTDPPTSVVGDTAFWNLGTMAGNSTVTLFGTSFVPIGTLGQAFTYHSDVTTTSVDTSPFNNAQSATNTIQGSYDPNDKQVWVANTGDNADGLVLPTDSVFRYLIRFQNTGTDTAFNIIVRDTFDADLNMSSLNITGASHPYTLQIPDSTGRRIAFVFDNILLVDSFANEPESHGWIQYEIRKKNGLANGTVISNRASIYFDFNLPVLTNTVNTTICPLLGTAFTFTTSNLTATLHGPTTGSANSWVWDFGDGQTGTGANPVHTYATAGTYNVCLTVGNACGRSSLICLTVTVACPPFNAAFTNTLTSMTAAFINSTSGPFSTLLWQFGDGSISSLNNPSHTYAQPGLYTVCLIVTNACGVHDTTCTNLAVGCNSAPVSNFTVSTVANVAMFTNTGSGTNATYFWNFGDGTNSTATNPTHAYTAVGTYNVCLTVTDACQNSANHCSLVTVTCVPTVSAFASAVNANTVTFTDQTANTPTTWAWDFGDGGNSTVANPMHSYTAVGTYQVCLMTTNACGQSDTCSDVVITTVVGLPAEQLGNIALLPNPAQDHVQLRMDNAQLESATFKLCDALGRVVYEWQATHIQGDYVRDIDLRSYAAGVYFLRISSQTAQQTLRVVKQE